MKTSGLFLFFFFTILSVVGQNGKLGDLEYYVSEGNNTEKDPPIVIMLHGYGSNENDLIGLVNKLPASYRVISVRAPIKLGDGSFCWYNLDKTKESFTHNSSEVYLARRQIHRFIMAIRYRYKSDKIYLLGFSQGTAMCYDVALTYPELVKGVVALSGKLLPESRNSHDSNTKYNNLQVFIGHGVHDNVLSLFSAREAVTILRELGAKFSYNEYPIGHEISANEIDDLLEWFADLIK